MSRFLAAGEAVRVLAWLERRTEAGDCPHEIVWGDISDPEAVERAVRGVAVVVHTVSKIGWYRERGWL